MVSVGSKDKDLPSITFIDVPDSQSKKQSESYINEIEAQSMIDYYIAFLQDKTNDDGSTGSLCMLSLFRTQAH